MRRAMLAVLLVLAGLGVLAPSAMAHPLGNFSINHLSTVKVSEDRVDVLYVLDEAEIPTAEQQGLSRAELIERKQAELRRNLSLFVDGRRVELRRLEPRLSFPAGQAGLETTRFEQPLRAAVSDPRRVQLTDDTFADRVGWKAVVSAPGSGTAVRTDAPSGDPTNGLRRYPENLLDSPLDRREASFSVQPGAGTLMAPRAEGGETSTTRTGGDGFAGIFEDAASGEGVLVLLLLAAFGWGALHALSPGHGKAMVAAYLVGTRGKPRHAVALGATVTVAHTVGVFALGFVTLALSQYILPEDLYPWLNLVSGLLVVVIGAAVLRSRVNPNGGHGHHHSPRHSHDHDHSHSHAHAKSFSRAGFEHFLDHARGREHGHSPDHDHAHYSHDHHHHRPGRRRRFDRHQAQPDRPRRRGGPDSLPLGARGAAGRDLTARGGPRAAADHRVQPRAGRNAHRPRPGRGVGAAGGAAAGSEAVPVARHGRAPAGGSDAGRLGARDRRRGLPAHLPGPARRGLSAESGGGGDFFLCHRDPIRTRLRKKKS